jgi:hypothetical protein
MRFLVSISSSSEISVMNGWGRRFWKIYSKGGTASMRGVGVWLELWDPEDIILTSIGGELEGGGGMAAIQSEGEDDDGGGDAVMAIVVGWEDCERDMALVRFEEVFCWSMMSKNLMKNELKEWRGCFYIFSRYTFQDAISIIGLRRMNWAKM